MITPSNAADALAVTEARVAQLQAVLGSREKTHGLYRQAIRANIDAALVTHVKLKDAKRAMVRDRNALYTSARPTKHLPVEIVRRVLEYLFAMDVHGRNDTPDWASHDDIIAEFLDHSFRNAATVIPPTHLAAHRVRAWGSCAWRPFAEHRKRDAKKKRRAAVRQEDTAMTWNRARRVLDSREYGKGGGRQVQVSPPSWKTAYITATSMPGLIDVAVRAGTITRLRFVYRDCPLLKIVVFGKLGLVEIHHPRADVIARILKTKVDIPSFWGANECVSQGDWTLAPDHTTFYIPYVSGQNGTFYHMGHGGRVAITGFL